MPRVAWYRVAFQGIHELQKEPLPGLGYALFGGSSQNEPSSGQGAVLAYGRLGWTGWMVAWLMAAWLGQNGPSCGQEQPSLKAE